MVVRAPDARGDHASARHDRAVVLDVAAHQRR
jgi:hypothetical protein